MWWGIVRMHLFPACACIRKEIGKAEAEKGIPSKIPNFQFYFRTNSTQRQSADGKWRHEQHVRAKQIKKKHLAAAAVLDSWQFVRAEVVAIGVHAVLPTASKIKKKKKKTMKRVKGTSNGWLVSQFIKILVKRVSIRKNDSISTNNNLIRSHNYRQISFDSAEK